MASLIHCVLGRVAVGRHTWKISLKLKNTLRVVKWQSLTFNLLRFNGRAGFDLIHRVLSRVGVEGHTWKYIRILERHEDRCEIIDQRLIIWVAVTTSGTAWSTVSLVALATVDIPKNITRPQVTRTMKRTVINQRTFDLWRLPDDGGAGLIHGVLHGVGLGKFWERRQRYPNRSPISWWKCNHFDGPARWRPDRLRWSQRRVGPRCPGSSTPKWVLNPSWRFPGRSFRQT